MRHKSLSHEQVKAKHEDGVPAFLIELARQARNPRCVDCARESMGGGLRCYDCYSRLATPEKSRPRRRPGECGTDAGYKRHERAGEPACFRCLEAHREYRREQRWRSAA